MKPNQRQIKSLIKYCRKTIEEPGQRDSVIRIAQAMEESLRWATEETVGWKMRKLPYELADLIDQ